MTVSKFDAVHKNEHITVSGGGLIASTVDPNGSSVRSTTKHASGILYFEYRVNDAVDQDGNCRVGVCTPAFHVEWEGVANASGHFAFYMKNGTTNDPNRINLPNGEWAGVIVNRDTQQMWWRNAAGWINAGDPEQGINPCRGIGSPKGDQHLGDDLPVYVVANLFATDEGVPSSVEVNLSGPFHYYPETLPANAVAWGANDTPDVAEPVATIVMQTGYSASISGNVVNITKDA